MCHLWGGHFGCPTWSPDGEQALRSWSRELQAWINVTSARMTTTQQAAAIPLSTRGIAYDFALTIPSQSINFGAVVNGRPIDPVTYILFLLRSRYEALEGERRCRAPRLCITQSRNIPSTLDSL